MKRLIAIVLFTACATTAPTPPPQFTVVPSSALDAMCARMHDEGIATTVDVVRTSRPLVTQHSLQALLEMAFQRHVDSAAAEAAFATNQTPLPLARNATCSWNAVDATARRSGDTMTVELSAPFAAPFSRGGTGVLARLSLGGESATWYWIPLANKIGAWVAGRATALSLHE